ncbi:hypothetical protein SEPCBS119000_005225 [Sporothrix epigloea]|uniref:Uncharacterized protein n=1 Tax=Sporothrix epigloea TaxID=1892477 RepID=A0ABP0E072_9PEZI
MASIAQSQQAGATPTVAHLPPEMSFSEKIRRDERETKRREEREEREEREAKRREEREQRRREYEERRKEREEKRREEREQRRQEDKEYYEERRRESEKYYQKLLKKYEREKKRPRQEGHTQPVAAVKSNPSQASCPATATPKAAKEAVSATKESSPQMAKARSSATQLMDSERLLFASNNVPSNIAEPQSDSAEPMECEPDSSPEDTQGGGDETQELRNGHPTQESHDAKPMESEPTLSPECTQGGVNEKQGLPHGHLTRELVDAKTTALVAEFKAFVKGYSPNISFDLVQPTSSTLSAYDKRSDRRLYHVRTTTAKCREGIGTFTVPADHKLYWTVARKFSRDGKGKFANGVSLDGGAEPCTSSESRTMALKRQFNHILLSTADDYHYDRSFSSFAKRPHHRQILTAAAPMTWRRPNNHYTQTTILVVNDSKPPGNIIS